MMWVVMEYIMNFETEFIGLGTEWESGGCEV